MRGRDGVRTGGVGVCGAGWPGGPGTTPCGPNTLKNRSKEETVEGALTVASTLSNTTTEPGCRPWMKAWNSGKNSAFEVT
jgi:hypothetical protein